MPVEFYVTASFKRDVRKLKKHFPHISDDLQDFLDRLEAGETPGTQIKEVGYPVYKLRLKSRDINRGADSAFRVLYYVKTKECIYLLAFYVKSQQTDIPMKALKALVKDTLKIKDLPC